MKSGYVFISHASGDDGFVKELREALENHGINVWVDSRNLRQSDKLKPEIEKAIEEAGGFIAVLSMNAVNSEWVRNEVKKALKVEKEGYRVISLLLPDLKTGSLGLWFDEEPVAITVKPGPTGLTEAMQDIMTALGERLPSDHQAVEKVEAKPVEELVLELTDPVVELIDGKRRARANATLTYHPAGAGVQEVESTRFTFTAPLGPIEKEELQWYLEKYHIWPTGIFKERAERVEVQLPKWGQMLYHAILDNIECQEAFYAWRDAVKKAEGRISVLMDEKLPKGTDEERQKNAKEAASELLSLPWELLHDGLGYIFRGRNAVRVRRRLPNRIKQTVAESGLPIRVLLVSPRPEDEHAKYIDHRASALPLVEAMEALGELVELTVLTPPTFPALEKALGEAEKPFDVIHFDGHGVYSPKTGLGMLCFEEPQDVEKLEKRRTKTVDAGELASVMRDYGTPLVFLEACQTAMSEDDPTASVAAKLLEGGVASVVAMSHSVLVTTSRMFVESFYQELAYGKRVGGAMLAGQQALIGDTFRGRIMGGKELRLQDWFVPVLYQEQDDPQLINVSQPKAVQQFQESVRKGSFGDLPEPAHGFIGRSRELLALERLLHDRNYAVIRGQGGAGKTALASELARWLVRTGRFQKAAFVAMDTYQDVRSVLDSIAHQLLPGEKYSVAEYDDIDEALLPVKRALNDYATIIVVDNMESVLPGPMGNEETEEIPLNPPLGKGDLKEGQDSGFDTSGLFRLCNELLKADKATRILFTSREPMPEPFDDIGRERVLGNLERDDAIKLVESVMAKNGFSPKASDSGEEGDVERLVEAVNCHARALVLLAGEVSRQGVRATTGNLHKLMAELDRQYPKDREKSLYASLELSLRRLPEDVRNHVNALAVFHGGMHGYVLSIMLKLKPDEILRIGRALVDVGLGQEMGYGYIQLDPALPTYLTGRKVVEGDKPAACGTEEELDELRSRWAEGMKMLTGYLYQQKFQNTQLQATLTILELPNLLAMLDWVKEREGPEEVVDLAQSVEGLLQELGRPRAMAYASGVREEAAKKLGEWSRARFNSECARIDRLIESGNIPEAYQIAQKLLENCQRYGEKAYPGADYDTAMAYIYLGRVLGMAGSAEAALEPLEQAQARFQRLADDGNTSAAGMAATSISEKAGCLMDLGRLDESARAYEDAIKLDEKLGDIRGAAVDKGQLGTVRMLQERYNEALKIYAEARDTFSRLGEPRMVATIWHQIGMVYKNAGQYPQAEDAYRQSLAIFVREKDRKHQADSLNELGNLYDAMGRLEEAVRFYRQAADIYVEIEDKMNEGRDRNNVADTLIKLGRYDEARVEIKRAIECEKPYGHAAQIWVPWEILRQIEEAAGNTEEAAKARGEAIRCYMAYRKAGGYSQQSAASGQLLALVKQAVQQGNQGMAKLFLAQQLQRSNALWWKAIISKLQAVLDGNRDPSLADDPELSIWDAVELRMMLEGGR